LAASACSTAARPYRAGGLAGGLLGLSCARAGTRRAASAVPPQCSRPDDGAVEGSSSGRGASTRGRCSAERHHHCRISAHATRPRRSKPSSGPLVIGAATAVRRGSHRRQPRIRPRSRSLPCPNVVLLAGRGRGSHDGLRTRPRGVSVRSAELRGASPGDQPLDSRREAGQWPASSCSSRSA